MSLVYRTWFLHRCTIVILAGHIYREREGGRGQNERREYLLYLCYKAIAAQSGLGFTCVAGDIGGRRRCTAHPGSKTSTALNAPQQHHPDVVCEQSPSVKSIVINVGVLVYMRNSWVTFTYRLSTDSQL